MIARSSQPVVTMFAGPNGSGKTTLKTTLEQQGAEFQNYLNADEFAIHLTGDPEVVSRDAQQIVRNQRQRLQSEGANYCFETVMSHPSHLDHLEQSHRQGYLIQIIFVGLENPLLNRLRVNERVASGGHDVPEDRIVARYHRCMALLPRALAISDRARVFDNSDADSPFRLIAAIENEKLAVYPLDDDLPSWFASILTGLSET